MGPIMWQNNLIWVCLSALSLSVSAWTLARKLLCPWDFPRKNTAAGCHFWLQEIFPTQESNLPLLCWQVDTLPRCHLGNPSAFNQFQFVSSHSQWAGPSGGEQELCNGGRADPAAPTAGEQSTAATTLLRLFQPQAKEICPRRQDRLQAVLPGDVLPVPHAKYLVTEMCVGLYLLPWTECRAHVLLWSAFTLSMRSWAGMYFFYTLNIKLKPKLWDMEGQESIPLVW